MTDSSYLPKSFTKNKIVRNISRQVLLDNLGDVTEMLEERMSSPQTQQKLYPTTKFSQTELDAMANYIEEYKRKDLFYDGYPLMDVEGILHYYQDEIRLVLDASGLTPKEQENHILVPLRNLIRCVHLIPASEHHHHRGLGGLIEHSLECAYYAAETAKGEVFERNEENGRPIPNNRWVAGAILCGMFHDVGKVMVNAVVSDASRKEVFCPYTETFAEWAFDKIGFGNNYYVTWQSKGDMSHETAMNLMLLVHNLICFSTFKWLGRTVAKQVELFFINSLVSKFKKVVLIADHSSVEHSMKFGQFQGTAAFSKDPEMELLFEAIKRMLAYGDEYKDENGEPKEFEAGRLKFRGWAINTPTSAAVYTDSDHLFFFWDDFKQLRVELEILGMRNTLFDLSVGCAAITPNQWEEEFYSLAKKLLNRGYVHPFERSPYWNIYRVDPKTGKPSEKTHKAICFNKSAIKIIFEYMSRPKEDGSLILVPTEHIETAEGDNSTTDNPVENSDNQDAQEETVLSQEQKQASIPKNDFGANGSKKPNPKTSGVKYIKESELVLGPPKKTLANAQGELSGSDLCMALLWEKEYPTGTLDIDSSTGAPTLYTRDFVEICNKYGCPMANVKDAIRSYFSDNLYIDGKTKGLVFTGRRYFRKE